MWLYFVLADVNEIAGPNDDEDKSLINKSVSMDFILRDTFKITKKNDQILAGILFKLATLNFCLINFLLTLSYLQFKTENVCGAWYDWFN